MGNLLFVTAATKDYRPSLVFHSLRKLSGRVVCLLEPGDRRLLPVNCQRLEYPVKGGLHQTGRFVTALPGVDDDDVVVLADADAIFQRDLSQQERALLADLGDRIAMGYNSRPGQKGWEEYSLLGPRLPIDEAARLLYLDVEPMGNEPITHPLKDCPVYNTGFMAAKVRTWRLLNDLYGPRIPKAGMFERVGWVQLMICAVLYAARSWVDGEPSSSRIPVLELGYSVHSNGHFALTSRHRIVGRRLYYDDQLVLFAHNVAGVADLN